MHCITKMFTLVLYLFIASTLCVLQLGKCVFSIAVKAARDVSSLFWPKTDAEQRYQYYLFQVS